MANDFNVLLQKLIELKIQRIQQQQQSQTDIDSISNVGNPNVNVNIGSGGTSLSEVGKLTEFVFDTESSTNPFAPSTPLTTLPTIVADVTLSNVQAGNDVWLNGIYHINNNSSTVEPVVVTIYKDSIANTNIIYQSIIEIDSELRDDFNQIITVQHVDSITSFQSNVRYILTAQEFNAGADLILNGPITFTAAKIRN